MHSHEPPGACPTPTDPASRGRGDRVAGRPLRAQPARPVALPRRQPLEPEDHQRPGRGQLGRHHQQHHQPATADGRLHPDFGQDYGSRQRRSTASPTTSSTATATPKVHVVIDAYPGESDLQDAPIPANAVIEGDFQNGPDGRRGQPRRLAPDRLRRGQQRRLRVLPGVAARRERRRPVARRPGIRLEHEHRHLPHRSAAPRPTPPGCRSCPAWSGPTRGCRSARAARASSTTPSASRLQNSVILNQFLYPASHVANPGNTNAAVQPPMGARFRLKAGVDISQLNPESQVIAQAMKDYGLILADNGSNFFFSGASYSVDASNHHTLTWNDNDIQDSPHGLKSLHFSDFEVVDPTPVVTGLSATSGAAGTTVTVVGQNFSGAAGHLQVLFGSTPATNVTVVDDGHVTAVVPAGSGTVDVRVQSGVTTPADPSNVKSPVFGYGISAVTTADRFTYTTRTTNHPPVAQDDTATTAGRGTAVTVDVLANDSDPDGDPLTVTSVTQPAYGSVVVNADNTRHLHAPGRLHRATTPSSTPSATARAARPAPW